MCAELVAVTNKKDYENKWNAIKTPYDDAAKKISFNVMQKHCQTVTEEIIKNLGYTMPAAISAQFEKQKELQNLANQNCMVQ